MSAGTRKTTQERGSFAVNAKNQQEVVKKIRSTDQMVMARIVMNAGNSIQNMTPNAELTGRGPILKHDYAL